MTSPLRRYNRLAGIPLIVLALAACSTDRRRVEKLEGAQRPSC